MAKRIFLGSLAMLVTFALLVAAVLAWQANRPIDKDGEYVALGSSFAAGIGIGERAPGSPMICMRTTGGYPDKVAARLDLKLVNMACSGSTATHILRGGQVFLPPQLAAVGPNTRLVTVTTGGNDVGYIGDLTVMADSFGPMGKWIYGDVKPAAARAYASVTRNLVEIAKHVRKVAPAAKIVIVNYPVVLPPAGNCAALGIDDRQAAISREVATRLDTATRDAAQQARAILVDAASASAGHDACAVTPWVHGARPVEGVAFHPGEAGAANIAATIVDALHATAG